MKKTNHELLRCVRVQVGLPPFKVNLIGTLVVLEGGQGNYDFDGNDGGGIDFDFCLMMILEVTGRKVEWIVVVILID